VFNILRILLVGTMFLVSILTGCSPQNKENTQNPVEIDVNNVAHVYLSSVTGDKELTQEEVNSIVDLVNSAENWREYDGPHPKGGESLVIDLKLKETMQLWTDESGFIIIGSSGSYNAQQPDYASTFSEIYSRKEKKLTKDEALVKAIEHHNTSVEVKSDYDFPATIKEGNTVTKEVKVGGPAPGVTLNLEMTAEGKKEGDKYIVILTEDYNATVSGTKAISYWKYEVSTHGVKLMDKKENGNSVKGIK
jgi:hypothetical protein